MNEWFRVFARHTARLLGTAGAFIVALAIVIVWAATGPIFGFSETWQLVINTGTTIVTFLMVFLIQNTQNRGEAAIQLKLDELIRSIGQARNRLIELEDLSDEELERLRSEFQRLGKKACDEAVESGKSPEEIERCSEEHSAKQKLVERLQAARK